MISSLYCSWTKAIDFLLLCDCSYKSQRYNSSLPFSFPVQRLSFFLYHCSWTRGISFPLLCHCSYKLLRGICFLLFFYSTFKFQRYECFCFSLHVLTNYNCAKHEVVCCYIGYWLKKILKMDNLRESHVVRRQQKVL